MQMEGNHQLLGLVSAVVTLSQSEDGFQENKTDRRPGHWASGFSEDPPELQSEGGGSPSTMPQDKVHMI